MRCPNCNNEITSGKFCVYCGMSLSTVESAPEGTVHADNITVPDFEKQKVSFLENHVYDSPASDSNDVIEENPPLVKGRKKGKGILFAILAVLVFLGAIKIREKLDIRDVLIETKTIAFESYGTEEFGKVAYQALKEIEWSIKKIDNRNYEVTTQGFSPDYRCLVTVILDVHVYGGEIYAEVSAVSDGEDTYYDIDTISDVLTTFYSYS